MAPRPSSEMMSYRPILFMVLLQGEVATLSRARNFVLVTRPPRLWSPNLLHPQTETRRPLETTSFHFWRKRFATLQEEYGQILHPGRPPRGPDRNVIPWQRQDTIT